MRYVVEVSSAAQPLLYKVTALWGRMSGSHSYSGSGYLPLLAAIVVWQNHRYNKQTGDTLAAHALIPIAIVPTLLSFFSLQALIEGVYNPLARFPNGQIAHRMVPV